MTDDDYETYEEAVDWMLPHVRALSSLVSQLYERMRQLEKKLEEDLP